MSETQYLNEEKYQANRKRIKIFAILVLIIGLLIGGGLIATGIIKNNQVKLSEEEIEQVQKEIDNYNIQLSTLKYQEHQELSNNGFSENYYNLDNQINKIKNKINLLEEKLDPDTSYLIVFYMLGGFAILATVMEFGFIYVVANGREINSFYSQQQIPVAKEGIEKMAPAVGNAAEEIARGIKEGLKDEEK